MSLPVSLRSARLLVVDDVREILPLFASAAARCRTARFDVVATADPREALRLAGAEAFDVVIADYRMPCADGLDVLAAARRRNPEGLRVLASGFREATLPATRMEAARPHRFLEKPIERGELAIFLERLLAESPPWAPAPREPPRGRYFPATMRRTSPSTIS